MTEDKSLKLEVESFGNYACRSREQIRRWRNFTAFTADGKKLSRQNLSLDFVGTILVLSASREKLKVKRINGYDGQNLIALANDS